MKKKKMENFFFFRTNKISFFKIEKNILFDYFYYRFRLYTSRISLPD